MTARAHYQKGTALYDLGKYDEAAAEFEAAYQAKSDPALLYNLAQANRLAGHPEQALHFYRTYLKRVTKPANKPEIESRIAQLEKQIEDQKADQKATASSAAATAGNPPPASSRGAGPAVPVATSSSPSAPSANDRGPAWTPPPPPPPPPPPSADRQATAPGATTQPPPLGAQPPPMQPVVGGLGVADKAPPVESSSGKTQRLVGIGLMAGGGAVAIGGIVFGALAVSKANELETLANTRGVYDPNIQAQGKTFQTLQWVCYGVGAASAITGLVVFLTAPSGTEGPTATPQAPPPKNAGLLVRLQPLFAREGVGAALQGMF